MPSGVPPGWTSGLPPSVALDVPPCTLPGDGFPDDSLAGTYPLLVLIPGAGSGSGSTVGAVALHSALGEAEAWIQMELCSSKTDPGPHSN